MRLRTKVLTDSEEDLERAASALARGALVAFPTDTVYGVGAHAFRPAAVGRLYHVKLRPIDKAIPLLIAPEQDFAVIAREIPPTARTLAERFWPGGLTLVLPRAPDLPGVITAGGDTVAVRVPDHPLTLTLIRKVGAPLAATSANMSGRPSPIRADEVVRELGGRIEYVVDGGQSPGGVESTVVDCARARPVILRLGAVSREAIEQALGQQVEIE